MNTSYNKNNQAKTKPIAIVAVQYAGKGLLTGKNQDPATGKFLSLKGIVLQKQNADGGGFFLNQNQSGEVFFGP